jgi:predicted dehydrogenase
MYTTKDLHSFAALLLLAVLFSCSTKAQMEENVAGFSGAVGEVKLMVLYPGHFHAALVQKSVYDGVDSVVHVYAPEGPELEAYLTSINSYNQRAAAPTNWDLKVYKGPDYLERMLEEKPGNVMVIAGNNQKKTEYIKAAVDAGIHVLADKPMAIDTKGFELLKESFAAAEKNYVLLYDIMTERFEISTLLQKEFSMMPEVFGTLERGSLEHPAVTKESVHHFFKYVSSKPLVRPAWFFDVSQQGDGIVDVTTHLVDLVQWACFPDQIIQYTEDIDLINARRWPTALTPAQFEKVTGLASYPAYLENDLDSNNILQVFSNGEINYKIKDVHARISVTWNYEVPEGGADSHYSIMRGTKANLIIRQGAEENFQPELYIEPVAGTDMLSFEEGLQQSISKLQQKYPGVQLSRQDRENLWKVIVPESYRNGHEAHFEEVTRQYLQYLAKGSLPDWEVPNMLSKYYVTTKALEMAKPHANPAKAGIE